MHGATGPEDGTMSTLDLDQSTCMSFLEPHLFRLHRAMKAAFARYQETAPHIIAEHDERAATSSVHSHIVHEITKEFGDVTCATILDARGLKVLNIDDRVVFRFKKVNEDGRHRNSPTAQQKRFDRQLPLPGLPAAATRLTLGYEPDAAFSEIARITIGCPHGHGAAPLWIAQINSFDEQAVWEDITPARIPGTEGYTRFKDDDAATG